RRPRPVAAGAPIAAAPAETGSGGLLRALLEQGRLEEADAEMADAGGGADATTWTTMRALLDGQRPAVAAGLAAMLDLARASGEACTWDRYWTQRWWAALEWGDENERYEVLDHCRTRAYRHGDLAWWGRLTLSLAGLGRTEEAVRAFDEAHRLLAGSAPSDVRLDVLSDLVEGAAVLGDASRIVLAHRSVDWPEGRLVVVGPAVLCKGSVDRYRGLGLAAAGRWPEAGDCFRAAAEVHRALGAGPLLDRTHRQAERCRSAA
ncbi:MAG: hypothetical protein M3066_06890, partial [Actinomycetota bacterium]|nr:hypothetical protein [Actinomycetota bacterium]